MSTKCGLSFIDLLFFLALCVLVPLTRSVYMASSGSHTGGREGEREREINKGGRDGR